MTTKTNITIIAMLLAWTTFGQRFDQIKLSTQIDTQAINVASSSLKVDNNATGIVLKSESTIKLYTDDGENDIGIEQVFINDTPLSNIIDRLIAKKLQEVTFYTTSISESMLHSENPLWGKKLAVVGDSEAAGANSYPGLIGARNNMTVVNNAHGGSALVAGENALLQNYKGWIPQDSDYIIVHIGCNDGATWNAGDDDDSTATNIFKGAWNVFLQNLKTEYPNAKKAIMMPYYWNTTGGRDARVAWMKTRCDKYELEYIDAVEELDYDSTTRPHYFALEAGDPPERSWVHFSPIGHQRISYLYENFMKTRVQFSK